MAKTAVITGGSSGIGRACAIKFKDEGYSVYELSRSGEDFKGIKHINCDITDEQSVCSAIDKIAKAENKIDVLINNAGFGISGAVEFTSISEIKAQFDVNVFGAISVTKAALPFLRQCRGKILFISSAAAVFPIPFQSFYAASKAAINSISYSLRNELAPFGITVCTLMPGDVKTGFTSSRRQSHKGESIYLNRISKAISAMEKDEQNGMSAQYIAKKVYKYSKRSHLSTFHVIGSKYKLFYALYRILPFRLVNWLIGKMYG